MPARINQAAARRALKPSQAIEASYLATLRRVWAVAQGIIAQGLAPLFAVWEGQTDSRLDAPQDPVTGPRFVSPGYGHRYNPLAPRPLLPRIWNLSDTELRRLWPGISPADVRRYAPWAVARSEVQRIAYPGGLRATDDLEEYVRRAIGAERARTPAPEVETFEPLAREPGTFRLRPRYYATPILGPSGLPIPLPPLPRIVNIETINRQVGWIDMALGQLLTVENVETVIAPNGQRLATTQTRKVERLLGIDLRAGDPAMQRLIDTWRDRNVGLIETGLRANEASPRLRPSLLQDVSQVVEDAHRQGLRVEVLAHDLRERFGVSDSRAELIARDQILKLNGQIVKQQQMSVGIRRYRWSTSRDARVRERHQELEGTIQSWDTPPEVAPGRHEHPGGDYQCRCAAVPILPGEEV